MKRTEWIDITTHGGPRTWIPGEAVTANMKNQLADLETEARGDTIPGCSGCGARAVEKGRCAYCGSPRG